MTIAWVYVLLLNYFCSSVYSYDSGDDSGKSIQRHLRSIGRVKNFRLINADTNLPVATLKNGMVFNIAKIKAKNLNVQVTTNGTVNEIRFGYNGNSKFRTDSSRPYTLCGDNLPVGNYNICKELVVGNHTISATPYSVTGEVGVSAKISFTISNVIEQNGPDPSAGASGGRTATKSSTSGNCKIEKFDEPDWQYFFPNYTVSVGEPQGVLIGNDIVIFAGFINKFTDVINQTFARDVTTINSPWRRMDDMPLSVGITHAATTLVGQKVYLCGGYHGGHPGPHVPYCFVYDHSKSPGKSQWSKISNLPNGGTAGAGMIYDTAQNTLYYVGGGQRLVVGNPHPVDLNNTWKYSMDKPQSGWVASTPVPYKANHLSAVTHQNSKGQERHFFLGGQKSESEITGNLADTFEFVASKEKWIRRASMPIARSHATASTRPVRCGFIVAGGSFNSITRRKNRTSDVSYYNIHTNRWTSIGDIPVAMATPMVAIHPSGYMYFIDNTQQSFRRKFA